MADVLPPMLLIGVGIGTSFPALMTLAMSGATPQDSGLASGLVNTSAQVGGAIGLAILATLATGRTDDLLAEGVSNDARSTLASTSPTWSAPGWLALVIAITVLREVDPAAAHAARGGRGEPAGEREPAYSEAG